ncbi:unnamed protein product [Orchesella dallaii]|uniref:Uncharacterized protein n=1 Tax=Orchesella dallaii TaxID=48710 RepID=A0ABP1QCN2_9HEXA
MMVFIFPVTFIIYIISSCPTHASDSEDSDNFPSNMETAFTKLSSEFKDCLIHIMNYQKLDFQPSTLSVPIPVILTDTSPLADYNCYVDVAPSTASGNWTIFPMSFSSHCIVHLFLSPTIRYVTKHYDWDTKNLEPSEKKDILCKPNSLTFFWVNQYKISELGETIWNTPNFNRKFDFHVLLAEKDHTKLSEAWLNSYDFESGGFGSSSQVFNKILIEVDNNIDSIKRDSISIDVKIACEFCQPDHAIFLENIPLERRSIETTLNNLQMISNVPFILKNLETVYHGLDTETENIYFKQKLTHSRWWKALKSNNRIIDVNLKAITLLLPFNGTVIQDMHMFEPDKLPYRRYPMLIYNDPHSMYFTLYEETFDFVMCNGGLLNSGVSFADFTSSFDQWTWILTLASSIIIMILCKAFTYGGNEIENRLGKMSFIQWFIFVYGALLSQSSLSAQIKRVSLLFLTGTWLLISVVLSNSYLGDNITNLNAPRKALLFSGISDMKKRNVDVYLAKQPFLATLPYDSIYGCRGDDDIHDDLFSNKTMPCKIEYHSKLASFYILGSYFNDTNVLSKTGQLEMHILKDIASMGKIVSSNYAMLPKLMNDSIYAAIGDWSGSLNHLESFLKYTCGTANNKRVTLFKRIQEKTIKRSLGWSIKRWNNPNVHRVLNSIKTSGLMKLWKSLFYLTQKLSMRTYDGDQFEQQKKKRKGLVLDVFRAVTTDTNVVTVFYLLLMGTALAVASFVVEIRNQIRPRFWQVTFIIYIISSCPTHASDSDDSDNFPSNMETAFTKLSSEFKVCLIHIMNYQKLDFQPSTLSVPIPVILTDPSPLADYNCYYDVVPSTASGNWTIFPMSFSSHCIVHLFLSPTIKYVTEPYALKTKNLQPSEKKDILCKPTSLTFFWVHQYIISEFGETIWNTPNFNRKFDFHMLLVEKDHTKLSEAWLNSYDFDRDFGSSSQVFNKILIEVDNNNDALKQDAISIDVKVACEFCQPDHAIFLENIPLARRSIETTLNNLQMISNVPFILKNLETVYHTDTKTENIYFKKKLASTRWWKTLKGNNKIIDVNLKAITLLLTFNGTWIQDVYMRGPQKLPYRRYPMLIYNDPHSMYFTLYDESFDFVMCNGGLVDSGVRFADFTSSFDSWTWILTLASSIIIMILCKAFTNGGNVNEIRLSLIQWFIFVYGALLSQSSLSAQIKRVSLLFLTGTWLLISVVLSNSYLGNNITDLNAPRKALLFNGISDMKKRNVDVYLAKMPSLVSLPYDSIYGCRGDDDIHTLFSSKTMPCKIEHHSKLAAFYFFGNYYNVTNVLSKTGQQEMHILKDIASMGKVVSSNFAIIPKLMNDSIYAAIGDWSGSINHLESFLKRSCGTANNKRVTLFKRIQEKTIKRSLGWSIKRWNNPNVHRILNSIKTSGLMKLWKSLFDLIQKLNMRTFDGDRFDQQKKKRKGLVLDVFRAVTTDTNVVTVFYLLLMGTALAVASFIVEIRNKMQPLFWQGLISIVCFLRDSFETLCRVKTQVKQY